MQLKIVYNPTQQLIGISDGAYVVFEHALPYYCIQSGKIVQKTVETWTVLSHIWQIIGDY